MDFSGAYDALAQRLEDDLVPDPVKVVSRKGGPFRGFPERPALILLETGVSKVTDGDGHQPISWMARGRIVIYADQSADDETPGDKLLALIDGVLSACAWKAERNEAPAFDGYSSTLGGKVLGVWLDDDADIQDDPDNPAQVAITLNVTMELDAA